MTTITEAEIEDRGARNVREAREAVEAGMADLPTVAELVGPIVSAIRSLHDLQDLAWSVSFLDAGDEHEARLVALIDDAATLVEAAVDGCLAGDDRNRGHGRASRQLVYALAQAAGTCRQHHNRRVDQIIDAMEPA